MENKRRLFALITPPSVFLLFFFMVPLVIMALYTMKESSFGPLFPLSFEAFRSFFSNPAYFVLLLSSSQLALFTALLSILLAYPVSYYLVFYTGSRRVILLTLLILPAWISYLLRVLAWKVILGSEGLLNQLLISAGLIENGAPILLFSQAAVLITLVYVWIPFAALPIFAAMERIDPRLHEAAADLGASPGVTFWRVTFPLTMPGVASAFFFVFIPTLGEWVTPNLVGGVSGIMYGNLIQDQFGRALNWPLGALMSMVLLVLVGVFSYVFNRFIPITEVPVSS
ncbi:MAG: ABC transporter permease [Anaerolineales bacterium]|nr:ABC transporter permease [Anaerolineales bacterium]QYK51820.1 MAG: ABC transporter permease [Anaerolineales bacterium]